VTMKLTEPMPETDAGTVLLHMKRGGCECDSVIGGWQTVL
jgi:hypothetical protein